MSLYRMSFRLAIAIVGLLVVVHAPAENLPDMQLFAPAELRPYGSGVQAKEGYFFTFDGLKWSISAPDVTTIGREGLTRTVAYGVQPTDVVIQSNTLDTSPFRSEWTHGNRFSFGRIVGQNGWLVDSYRLANQSQNVVASSVAMTFVDDEFGPLGSKLLQGVVGQIDDPANPGTLIDLIADLPLTFDDVFVRNRVETWSVELMGIHRSRQCHNGGYWEFLYGVRYMEFEETFNVDARGRRDDGTTTTGDDDDDDDTAGDDDDDDTAGDDDDDAAAAGTGDDDDDDDTTTSQVPPILQDSIWETSAENHVFGPQLGLRYFKQRGRWQWSTEGRFMYGYNTQNIFQRSTLGTELDPPGGQFEPLLMDTTSATHSAHLDEWTPLAELRFDARYQLTRAVSIGAGWTGIWMNDIARASNMINYEVPTMGILPQHNTQDVWAHGWNISIVVNR